MTAGLRQDPGHLVDRPISEIKGDDAFAASVDGDEHARVGTARTRLSREAPHSAGDRPDVQLGARDAFTWRRGCRDHEVFAVASENVPEPVGSSAVRLSVVPSP